MKISSCNISAGVCRIQGDRESQQDSFLLDHVPDRPMLIASVCDGMGGLTGGEQASGAAAKVLSEAFLKNPPDGCPAFSEWMQDVLITADQEVSALKDENGRPLKAGSTCVMVLSDEREFLWGCVGDSRIMLLRSGTLYTLTRMHNLFLHLNELLRTGQIDADEYQKHAPQGEALISYLGIGNLSLIDLSANLIPWQEGDILILCSDGLYKALEDEQILAIIEESGWNVEIASKRLCTEAHRLSKKKQDNTTVILLAYHQEEELCEDA